MDYQVLFNGAVAVAAFFGGWTLNSITRTLERLDQDVRQMPMSYVQRDDYKADIAHIEVMLARIFDKLDGKADK